MRRHIESSDLTVASKIIALMAQRVLDGTRREEDARPNLRALLDVLGPLDITEVRQRVAGLLPGKLANTIGQRLADEVDTDCSGAFDELLRVRKQLLDNTGS